MTSLLARRLCLPIPHLHHHQRRISSPVLGLHLPPQRLSHQPLPCSAVRFQSRRHRQLATSCRSRPLYNNHQYRCHPQFAKSRHRRPLKFAQVQHRRFRQLAESRRHHPFQVFQVQSLHRRLRQCHPRHHHFRHRRPRQRQCHRHLRRRHPDLKFTNSRHLRLHPSPPHRQVSLKPPKPNRIATRCKNKPKSQE